MKISRFSVKHPAVLTMVLLALLLFGSDLELAGRNLSHFRPTHLQNQVNCVLVSLVAVQNVLV